jgi:hypothetical protein
LELNIFLYSALEQLSVFKRLTLLLRGDDHDGIVTHGRSREFQSKREISRECNDIIGSAKGSQISEK